MLRHRMKIVSIFFIITILLSACPIPAKAVQTPLPNPGLVKDINTALTEGSNPVGFMPDGPVTYFITSLGQTSEELWKTDGTAAGTVLVKDGFWPSGGSFASYKGFLYFPAYTPEAGNEVWRTDGTNAGTSLFKDISQGSYGSDPGGFTVFEDYLYFGADMGRFCRSDGTPSGTIRNGGLAIRSRMMEFKNSLYYSAYVPDYIGNNDQYYLAWFGSGGSGQTTGLMPGAPLVVYKDRLYFTASRADVGQELWSTGGTSDSISLLKDINPAGDAGIYDAEVYNGTLYFAATDAENGVRLWQSDGSESGTLPVFAPPAGTTEISLKGAIQPAGESQPGGLLLDIRDASGNQELWRSDGTPPESYRLADLPKDMLSPSPGAFFNNLYYFSAYDSLHGVELWQTDDTAAGTSLLADLWPGVHDSSPVNFAPCGDRLCFSADDGVHGAELWSTDGTAQGTGMVADLNTRPANGNPNYFTRAQSLVYFFARDAIANNNLWRTDGTPEGTLALIQDPKVTISSDFYYNDPRAAVLGDTLFFPASDPIHGTELWKSDGTPEGTALVKDVLPGADSSSPRFIKVAGSRVFFYAADSDYGHLWMSDGTPGGTTQVEFPDSIASGSSYHSMIVLGDSVIINIEQPNASACELWRTNGTPQGTWRIADDLCINSNSSAVYQDKLYFAGRPSNYWRISLWETDGSAGTAVQVPVNGVDSLDTIDQFTATPGGLFIIGRVYDGFRLFHVPMGGSSAERIYNFYNINGVYAMLREVTGVGDKVAIVMSEYGSEVDGRADHLWFSDGSEAGTRRIEAGFSQPSNIMSSGGALYFFANDAAGTQLWWSDGTNSGTTRMSNYPQVRCMPWSTYRSVTAIGPGAFLLALDDQNNPSGSGCELWYYDALPQKVFLPAIRR